jgi:hypothetical protein
MDVVFKGPAAGDVTIVARVEGADGPRIVEAVFRLLDVEDPANRMPLPVDQQRDISASWEVDDIRKLDLVVLNVSQSNSAEKVSVKVLQNGQFLPAFDENGERLEQNEDGEVLVETNLAIDHNSTTGIGLLLKGGG